MSKRGHSYLDTKNLAFFSILAAVYCCACSAETASHANGGAAAIAAVGGGGGLGGVEGTNVVTNAGGAPGTTVSQTSFCEAKGLKQACYCPDGSKTGVQVCDASGTLQKCEGCSTDTKAGPSNAKGLLCPALQSAVGCTTQSYQSEELPASILFVMDRSASMSCNTPGDGQSSEQCEAKSERAVPSKPSKWEITVAALKEVFGKLNQSGARAGLMFFSDDGICGVNSDLTVGGVSLQLIDQAQVALLSQALDQQTPAGGTPLVGATILAYKQLHQVAGGDCGTPPCGAQGNRFVVLFTDGVDSCPDPSFAGAPCGSNGGGTPCTQYLLNTEVKQAIGANIRTFVIGAPGSELGRGFLSELAYQGGSAKTGCKHGDLTGTTGDCHFDMSTSQNFAADLAAALKDISGAAVGCEFAVPSAAGVDPNNVNVQYTAPGATPICIPRDDTKECKGGADGWQFAKNPDGSANLNKVVLCGNACTAVENIENVQVDVIIGCQTIVIL
jgi:hypothetical protein